MHQLNLTSLAYLRTGMAYEDTEDMAIYANVRSRCSWGIPGACGNDDRDDGWDTHVASEGSPGYLAQTPKRRCQESPNE
jgi:hypothetical protein